jgi:hypothetical protein
MRPVLLGERCRRHRSTFRWLANGLRCGSIFTVLLTSPIAAVAQDTPPPDSAAASIPPAREAAPAATGPNYLRPIMQSGVLIAGGLGFYFWQGERNHYDWPLSWSTVRERFTTLKHIRFDENEFAMNNVAHPGAGLLHYRFARLNGFEPRGAFVHALVGSTFWEMIIELREIASINDLIVTPFAGLALGEALHQHELFFRRAAPTRLNRMAAHAFAGPVASDRLLGGRTPAPAPQLPGSGLPSDRAHRLRLHMEYGPHAGGEPGLAIGASSEIGTGARDPAEQYWHTGAQPFTRLHLRLAAAGPALERADLGALAVFPGLRRGALYAESGGAPTGAALHVGAASAFYMHFEDFGARMWDAIAAADLLGVHVDAVRHGDILSARGSGGGYAAFSSMRPAALWPWFEEHGAIPLRAGVLYRNQYYFGYGYTLRTTGALEHRRAAIEGEVKHHRVRSLDNPHRRTDGEPNTLSARDTRTHVSAWLELRAPSPLRLGVGVEGVQARGTMGEFEASRNNFRMRTRVGIGR